MNDKSKRMMKARHIIFTLSAAVVGLSSCVKEAAEGIGDGAAVSFGAEVAATQTTRVLNDQWQTGDRIGISMITAGGTVEGDIKDGAFNRRFVYNNGFVADAGETIYYPADGSQVDFVSVYPWQDISGAQYPVSVGSQGNPAAIDVMYARTNGVTAGGGAVTLTFHHKLSRLAIKVNRGEGMENVNFSGMTATIGGMPISGTLDLNSGSVTATGAAGSIPMLKGSHIGTGYVGVFDAIVLPSESGSGRSVVFTVEGIDYTWVIPNEVVLSEGLRHTYIINVKRAGVEMIGATITPWAEEISEDAFADMFSIYLSGNGLQADLLAVSAAGVNAKKLRILGGELTVADFRFMRNDMPNLTELDIKNATVVANKIPDYAFNTGAPNWRGKNTLRRAILPETITGIGEHAFDNCIALESVIISGSVEAIGDYAFYSCTALPSISIPGSVQTIGNNAFSFCFALVSATIHEGVETIGNYGFYNCPELASIIIPGSVNTIGNSAFRECTALASATISEGVRAIDNYAFYNCTALTSITIPGSVGMIGNYAFQYCSALTSATISEGVQTIGNYAFSRCSALTSATIPGSIQTIGVSAFNTCTALISATIHEGVQDLGGSAFANCSALRSVTIPGSVKGIGSFAFEECSSLVSVTISEGVQAIGSYVFTNCTALPSVIIPGSVQTIGDSAFYLCTSLTLVTISEGVITIGISAFENCTSLKSIIIPSSVQTIKRYVFWDCTSLVSVTCLPVTPPTFGGSVFTNTPASLRIKVPAGSVTDYQTAPGWTTYAAQIIAIP